MIYVHICYVSPAFLLVTEKVTARLLSHICVLLVLPSMKHKAAILAPIHSVTLSHSRIRPGQSFEATRVRWVDGLGGTVTGCAAAPSKTLLRDAHKVDIEKSAFSQSKLEGRARISSG